ncbi:hypothetical protein GLAREA_12440 [Glarea lozoyensis ATCC 20868]|uniref:Uncharacterized protein n=1 Tax=Glarea lozoyensis (strain ATCC 20868 / MF5171) TaxID=1116229 RepID=S3D3E8_GLAL2|nr:uncharacterized protein GLAREA_12440 [Glarea lozoyensis ATCC 20868]EPE31684.1 hypothetical protein GLAREA_12440 [Glarea lozoyensis ATCC 20868]
MWSKKSGDWEDRLNNGWRPDASRSAAWLWEQNKSYKRKLTTLGIPWTLAEDDGYLRRKPTGSLASLERLPKEDRVCTENSVGTVVYQQKAPSVKEEAKLEDTSFNRCDDKDAALPNATETRPVIRPQITNITIPPPVYPAAPPSPDVESPQRKENFVDSSVDHTDNSSQTSVETSHPPPEQAVDPMLTPFEILWKRYQRQRINTWTLRAEVHRARSKLRGIQQMKAAADDAFFRLATAEILLGPNPGARSSSLHQKKLQDLMQECQALRDEYGPLENDCTLLEERLSREESKQNELEEEFHTRLEQRLPELQNGPIAKNLREKSPIPEAKIGDLGVTNLHPLAEQFLFKLGDFYMLDEQYNDMIDERQYLEEESARLRNVNMSLVPSDQDFLNEFETEEQKLAQRLNALESEIEIMRKDCLARGLIDEFDEPTSMMSQEKSHFKAEKDLNPNNNVSEYAKFPVLLPRPGSKPEIEVDIESVEEDKPQSRVNQWLLDQLRSSPLDVRLLASTFEKEGGGEPNDRWQFHVLSVWFRDETLYSTAAFGAYSSSLTTHAPPRSSNSSNYHF